ncbi:MAG: NUDIX hydrolase [Butyrivibrio sp.]|nr:NUDIX hydrolase [Butyrivibrio sp.]
MIGPKITKEKVKTIIDEKFIKVFDLQFEEGRHYFNATRRDLDNLASIKDDEEFKKMVPDAVSCVVVVDDGDESKLLLSYEYRYPAGRFLLGVPAGLVDPEDKDTESPVITTAIREIREETGIEVDESKDKIFVINPLLFSSPGLTDESNALVGVVLKGNDLSKLTQSGAEGQECFDGFALIDKAKAKELLKTGVDDRGHYYSVYTWAALMCFVGDMWK